MARSGAWARFDDLRNGEALLCPPPHRVLTATRPDEVAGVLQEVHEQTAAGSWAYGYVSYEAASGLDPRLPGGAQPGQPPLVWFGLCDEPARTDPAAAVTGSVRAGSSHSPNQTSGGWPGCAPPGSRGSRPLAAS